MLFENVFVGLFRASLAAGMPLGGCLAPGGGSREQSKGTVSSHEQPTPPNPPKNMPSPQMLGESGLCITDNHFLPLGKAQTTRQVWAVTEQL